MSDRRLKDIDSAGRAQNLRAASHALFGSIVFAALGAAKFGLIGLLLGWLIGAVLIYFVSTTLAARVGNAAATIYLTSGSSTPAQREYSLGAALAAQGKLQESAAEFERCATRYPDDPEPLVRLARLRRDGMQQPEEAALCFRRALGIASLNAAVEWALTRELTELYTHKLHDAARALPILARLAEHRAGTPAGAWARTEVVAIKQQLREARG